MTRRLIHLVPAVLAALALTGCGALSAAGALVGVKRGPPELAWTSITLAAAADANADSALAVDIVLVKDKALLDNLAAMPAAGYFAAREDLQRTFPEALTVLAFEVTPGQLLRIAPVRFKAQRAWAALAFARYASPGEHRLRLALDVNAQVLQLGAGEFVAAQAR